MKLKTHLMAFAAMSALAVSAQADGARDCLLKGTLDKPARGETEFMDVHFYSARKFDKSSRCRIRKGEKLRFKIPDDPRIDSAPDGAKVEYRYREDNDGKVSAELIKVRSSI